MNINRSRAVNSFKQYGHLWYHGAQKFPIDIYKDIILLHEFVETVAQLIHHHHAEGNITTIIQERHQAYHDKNFEHPDYGGFIEMMYRRRIGPEYVKSFFQSMLLNTTTITYKTEDEVKAYIYGIGEVLGLMVSEIIGCAPAGHMQAQAAGEGLWIIHMILDLPQDRPDGYHYIPQTILDQYHVSSDDILRAGHTHLISPQIRDLIKYYVDEHEKLCTYAIDGLSYLNVSGQEGVLLMMTDYEHLVDTIKKHDYNVFHPRFKRTISGKISGYLRYRFHSLTGKN